MCRAECDLAAIKSEDIHEEKSFINDIAIIYSSLFLFVLFLFEIIPPRENF